MSSNFILKNENAIFYECGYSCDNALYLSLKDECFFITDARYSIEARENIKNATVIESNSLIKDAKKLIKKFNIKKISFDPLSFSVSEFKNLSSSLNLNFKSSPNFSQKKREIKSQHEINLLKEAAKLGEKCFDDLAKFINESKNLSEEEINFNAQMIFRQNGALNLSFEPITAINANAAKAHALPTKTKLKNGDLLLVDGGIKFKRYCSDRTRTAFFDNKLNFSKDQIYKNQKHQEIYDIVKEAQYQAIKAIKPGILACEVDSIARDFIAKNGYGKEFFHSTGHGVGLDIHELPIISPKSKTKLKEGMVFSVEPGIYLENEFGVRIEDVVVVTKNGCEIL